MSKKRNEKELNQFEAERDVWQEVLDSVKKIKAGGGKRQILEPKPDVARARLKSGLTQ